MELTSNKINRWALPIAVMATFLSKLLVLPDWMFWYFFQIPIHELGHASSAWLCGHFAFPLGAILPMAAFTTLSLDFSFITFLAVLVGLLWSVRHSFLGRTPYPLLLCTSLLVALFYGTFVLRQDRHEMVFLYAGIGGEFVISALLIVSFYYRFPKKLHWDFFRFPAIFVGTYVFSSSFVQWWKIAKRSAPLPTGSFLGDASDMSGDIDRLIMNHGWTIQALVASYSHLAKVALAIILLHYFYFLKNRQPQSEQEVRPQSIED